VLGGGDATLLLVHGYGCNQVMWRHLAPVLAHRYRVVLLDLVGFGLSDHNAYDEGRYGELDAHARDVAEVAAAFAEQPLVAIGHSVGAMIALRAELAAPELFAAHVMVAPSPCFADDGDYHGGFAPAALEQLLAGQVSGLQQWADGVAALVAGEPQWSPLTRELSQSFCRADARAARQLARATFTGDHRDLLPALRKPTLLLQASDDAIAPPAVGDFMQARIAGSRLRWIEAHGHCPHLTQPAACLQAIEEFLRQLGPELRRPRRH
jgi:sigma-B regulation protein RsbQ